MTQHHTAACTVDPDHPVDGTAYACKGCADRTAKRLRTIADLADAARDAAYGLVRYGAGGRRADIDAPLPGNLAASTVLDECTTAITTWARHVAEERGQAVPTGRDPLATAATWLAGQLEYVRHQRWVEQMVDEVADVERRIVRLADRPAERVLVGACPCGTWLYAPPGREVVECHGCQAAYDVEASRTALWRALRDRTATAAGIATIAATAGHRRDRVHTLIRSWAADRPGRPATLVAAGQRDGQPVYRVGDVLDRIEATPSRNRG